MCALECGIALPKDSMVKFFDDKVCLWHWYHWMTSRPMRRLAWTHHLREEDHMMWIGSLGCVSTLLCQETGASIWILFKGPNEWTWTFMWDFKPCMATMASTVICALGGERTLHYSQGNKSEYVFDQIVYCSGSKTYLQFQTCGLSRAHMEFLSCCRVLAAFLWIWYSNQSLVG